MKKLLILSFVLLFVLIGCASIPTVVQTFSTERGSRPDGPDGFIIRNTQELNDVLAIFPGMDNTFNNRFFRNYGLVVIENRSSATFFTLDLIEIEFRSDGVLFVLLEIIPRNAYPGQQMTSEVIVIRVRQSSLRNMKQLEIDFGMPIWTPPIIIP